jgi:hypothetical protein
LRQKSQVLSAEVNDLRLAVPAVDVIL